MLGQDLDAELGVALADGGDSRLIDRADRRLGARARDGIRIGQLLASGIDKLDA